MSTRLKELATMCKPLQLLYVEDDEQLQKATFNMLSHFFDDISCASNGIEGLEKCNDSSFDLIISDIAMPKMSGLEMLKALRARKVETPVIIVSAFNDNENLLQAIQNGADAFIVKPIHDGQFLTAIEKTVTKIDLQKKNERYRLHLEEMVEQKTAEIVRRLTYDHLTGLRNRNSFFHKIQNEKTGTVTLVDINQFHIINEVYGNTAGSQILQAFAEHLKEFASLHGQELFRISGDEFAFVSEETIFNNNALEKLLFALLEVIKNFCFLQEGLPVHLDVTIGVSHEEDERFIKAKEALDYAKTHALPFYIYSQSIDRKEEQKNILHYKEILLHAIEHGGIVPVFQPIVNSDGKVLKHEILMRIKYNNELLSPSLFLDIALKTRLYSQLSRTIIFKALDSIKTMHHTLTLNLNYSDMKDEKLIQEMLAYFINEPDVAKRCIFEITETESITDYKLLKEFLKEFKKTGVRIAIDDFGSGYSNFSHILDIEPEFIKIDGSLIKDIDNDTHSLALVNAIVNFSHKLNITTVAEYVHNEKVFTLLKELNVDEYQGFYFSRPLEHVQTELV